MHLMCPIQGTTDAAPVLCLGLAQGCPKKLQFLGIPCMQGKGVSVSEGSAMCGQ